MLQIKKREIILAILNVFSAFSFVSLAYFSKYIIDYALNKDFNNLILYIIIFMSFLIFGIILKLIYNYLTINFNLKYQKEFKTIIYNKLIREDFSSNRELTTKIINYNEDINNVILFKVNTFPNIVFNISRLFFATILLLMLNYILLLIFILVFSLASILGFLYHKYSKKYQESRLKEEGKLNTYFKDSMANRDLIYSYNAYKNYENNHDKYLDKYISTIKKESNLRLFANNFIMILNYAITALIIILGAYFAYNELITYGFIIALLQIVNHIANPIISASSYISSYALARVSNKRLEINYFDDKEQIEDFDSIIFDDVTYNINNKTIIEHFTFKISKNDIIKIVGDSGTGKSTLIKLILGIIKPISGKIYYEYNGLKYDVDSCLNLVSYLNQEINLMNCSIRDNFLLYSNVSDDRIRVYLKIVNLDSRILSLDELINNEDLNLSVGEKQRLMFAVMLSTDRKIIILDEFDSNLDKNNTNMLINILNSLEKTIIYVSHKESIIEKSKILNIED